MSRRGLLGGENSFRAAELTYPEEMRDKAANVAFSKLIQMNREYKEVTGNGFIPYCEKVEDKIKVLEDIADLL